MKRIAALILAAASLAGAAQQNPTETGTGARSYIERGMGMLATGNYVGARDQFTQALAMASQPGAVITDGDRQAAQLGMARAAVMQQSPGALALVDEFMEQWPASALLPEAHLLRADCLLYSGLYLDALLEYQQLTAKGSIPADLRYRLALAQMLCQRFPDARQSFAALMTDDRYVLPARFYSAYMDYAEGDYAGARRGFTALQKPLERLAREDRRQFIYQPTHLDAAFYLTQIDFHQGKYQDVINRLPSMRLQLNNQKDVNTSQRLTELLRLEGVSAFRLGDRANAERPLEEYIRQAGGNPLPDAIYALAVIRYDQKDYTRAANLFSQVSDTPSAIGQGASLYLGQIAVRDKDYNRAATAFRAAMAAGYDPAVTETAHYNYLAAVMNGASAPFASTVDAIEEFLTEYPSSRFAPVLRKNLAKAYCAEKNYPRALQAINAIPNPDAEVNAVRQLIQYEYGMQLMANNNAREAAAQLTAATKGPDRDVSDQALPWLAEALYDTGDFPGAQRAATQFLKTAPRDNAAPLVRYNLAYSLYMQDKFAEAIPEFRAATDSRYLAGNLRADALVRLADCYYYTKNYSQAAALFRQASRNSIGDPAYAAMRAAMMDGLQGDNNAKITGLEEMIAKYPASKWVPGAMYELGLSYADINRIDKAAGSLNTLCGKYPDTDEARQGQLMLGLIYARAGMDQKAIDTWQALIRCWPTSDRAASANVELQRLMSKNGQLDRYVAFINTVPDAPRIDPSQLDRLTFEAAESQWLDNDNLIPLEDYVARYPDGTYLADALRYLAEGYADTGRYSRAIEMIDHMAKVRPDAVALPEALLMKAQILERQFPARADEALRTYRDIEKRGGAVVGVSVYSGIMRLSRKPEEVMKYAAMIENTPGVDAATLRQAALYKALAMARSGQTPLAIETLTTLAKDPQSEEGARAAVELAQIYLDANRPRDAREIMLRFTDSTTPHQYWLARGYIALADAYTALGDKATAREYLLALRGNYPGTEPDIPTLIDQRLK